MARLPYLLPTGLPLNECPVREFSPVGLGQLRGNLWDVFMPCLLTPGAGRALRSVPTVCPRAQTLPLPYNPFTPDPGDQLNGPDCIWLGEGWHILEGATSPPRRLNMTDTPSLKSASAHTAQSHLCHLSSITP